ncbi:MAG: Sua5/YciO/YrdC/YwlC family protein [Pseudomonadaceae bacterium]|nr:Sua5/YciO/YrdC/YwlC family protein [Pseudomonadaceae bacterium]
MSTWPDPQLHDFVRTISAGKVAIAPAEGMYGYCADPFNPAALKAITRLKRRDERKGLITLIGHTDQLAYLCPHPLPKACVEAIHTHWGPQTPPVTLILPALPTLPILLTGGRETLAIRLPACPYMQEYLRAAGGPLVSTSCNLSGEPPATQACQLPAETPALSLPQPLSGMPSRIFNPQNGQWLR